MSAVRLFFALWPSPPLAASLAEWAQAARPHCGGRVMRTETLHLTLAFLGPVEAQLADALAAATPDRCVPPGELELDRYGVFKRQRILWAGPREAGPREAGPREAPAPLQAMHDGLWQWLAGYGLAAPPQPFRPHVTLLRNIERDDPPPPPPDPLIWRYDRLVLVASESQTGGSRYRIVAQSRPLSP
ncbi:RNA 2',3'-cyclic phosphodiesterase [Achromobacter spanius]